MKKTSELITEVGVGGKCQRNHEVIRVDEEQLWQNESETDGEKLINTRS